LKSAWEIVWVSKVCRGIDCQKDSLLWRPTKIRDTRTYSVDKKNQIDVTFCILYFSSNSCSTCLGQLCAPSSGADDCMMLWPRVGMCRGCRNVVKSGWQVVRPWTQYLPTGLIYKRNWQIIAVAFFKQDARQKYATF